MNIRSRQTEAIELLKLLIHTPSFSTLEEDTANLIESFFSRKGLTVNRKFNNIWVSNQYFDASKPTLLLNSHLDTVRPGDVYTLNPFKPQVQDGKLFGLGSNDAGGALVSLTEAFLHFYDNKKLKYNIIMAATAEEENSGVNGIECILPLIPPIDFAVVGEPTNMDLAIAEKGLLVLDCVSKGVSGHAAREEGINSIYLALPDIEWFKTYQFPKISDYLGKIKMSVTMINSGTQHNVVPEKCSFTVDVRVTDCYTHEEIMEVISKHVKSEVKPRSMRLKSSSVSINHPFVQAGISLGRKAYGSPTTSDQAVINCSSLKLGPGDSSRSHTADEFIYINEIEEGIELYIKMLEKYLLD
jgi:acetylornithine deacetylase